MKCRMAIKEYRREKSVLVQKEPELTQESVRVLGGVVQSAK